MSALGTELKINVTNDPIDGFHMGDYDFECAFYVYTNRRVVKKKSEMKKVDDDNYLGILKTDDVMRIGRGRVLVEMTAYIPDADFEDGFRTERDVTCTDAVIV
ncbi:MAG: hypothetical protein J6U65_00415 [Bacteroidaceae bacterium]|nr:hypothetical protein [Bacteroidaceae bacterium]